MNLAFIGPKDMLVLEKATGRVQRVIGGVVHSTVLELAVNSTSERVCSASPCIRDSRRTVGCIRSGARARLESILQAATDVPLLATAWTVMCGWLDPRIRSQPDQAACSRLTPGSPCARTRTAA